MGNLWDPDDEPTLPDWRGAHNSPAARIQRRRMKTLKRRWFSLFFCLPANLLFAWPAVLFVRWRWGRELRWEERFAMTVEMTHAKRPKWFHWNAMTMGHGIVYAPGRRSVPFVAPTRTQRHEWVHVEQAEGWCAAGFALGLVVLPFAPWPVALAIWTLCPAAVWLGHTLTAVLRGESAYWGAVHEEAAYGLESERQA